MADIVIAAFGSRGDIMPLTDVGCRLQEAGHRVVLTSNIELDGEVRECGLDARGIDAGLDTDLDPSTDDALRIALQLVRPAGMRRLGHNLLDAIGDVPADVLLLTPFAELAGHPLAEARGIPGLGLRLQPLSATRDFPPSLLGAWSGGGMGNRMAGVAAAQTADRVYGATVDAFRTRLGLPRRSARLLRKARTAAEWPILHGVSPSVVPRPADWRSGLDTVGYWWQRTPESWSPPEELTRFLSDGPSPVFVGFGSLVIPDRERERLMAVVRDALAAAGVRGVVQSGGAGLTVTGDGVLTIGPVPHEWLFTRVAAVVHSCGAGTTAAGLRAGVPAVAVPSPGGDQPFWARRLRDLGVSLATLPRPRLASGPLAAAITAAVTDPGYRERAQRIAQCIAREDGAGQVVSAVERLLDGPAAVRR
ncbi:glycosyltransferase [Tsukamurella soli]|uniref:Glycosyltransferase n=1 Tax=Tsukamurella soli TaxID=644556 RepID=A0ABP8JSJ4_9ACTN